MEVTPWYPFLKVPWRRFLGSIRPTRQVSRDEGRLNTNRSLWVTFSRCWYTVGGGVYDREAQRPMPNLPEGGI